MRIKFNIIGLILAVMVAASSCVAAHYVKEAPAPQTAPIQFDWDGDGTLDDYWYPDFTATVIESQPGVFVATLSGDQRSQDTGLGASTMKVTVDGVTVCEGDTYSLVGVCVVPATYSDGEPHAVGVYIHWREASETLWTGFIQS